MATVHRSEGRCRPRRRALRSEPAIVAGIARATLGERERACRGRSSSTDYDRIRERIARVVPGCERMNERVREPGGFMLPRGPAERRFATPSGNAELRVVPLPRHRGGAGPAAC